MTDTSATWDAILFARCVVTGNHRRADKLGEQTDPQVMRDTLVVLLTHVLDAALPNKRDQVEWLDTVAATIQLGQRNEGGRT